MRQPLLLLFSLPFAVLSGERVSSAQTISIFGNAVPSNPTDRMNPATVGVKFWSSVPGTIDGIRFYRAAHSSAGYVATLYTADGTLLGSATLTQESGSIPGWQEAVFASPISISANTTYIAAYYSPGAQGARDAFGLAGGATNGPLTAPASQAVGGNGVFQVGNAFPTKSFQDSNYYVDVAFSPTISAPYLTLSFDPPNPSIPADAPFGFVVATITASWSDGSPFIGTLSFAAPYSNDQAIFAISGNTLIINPSGPGLSADNNNTLNVTIAATQ